MIPNPDLRDEKMRTEQRTNVARFRTKWMRVIDGLVGMFGLLLVCEAIDAKFNLDPNQEQWFALAFFLIGIPTVISMMLYKCPKCGTVPAGTAYSLMPNAAIYSKGIHPFPSRCTGCDSYLSKRALEKDLAKLADHSDHV
jgi:hypothetical protein